MKKFLVILILAIVFSSCSQVKFLHVIYGNERTWEIVSKQDVPSIVVSAFEKKYPENASVSWMKPNKNKYAVSFMENGKMNLAVFSVSGILQDEENYDPEDYFQEEEYDNYWEFDMYD